MSDIIIFCMGCLVSLVVASAVGLLLWGAKHEPHERVIGVKTSDRDVTPTRPTSPASASGPIVKPESLA